MVIFLAAGRATCIVLPVTLLGSPRTPAAVFPVPIALFAVTSTTSFVVILVAAIGCVTPLPGTVLAATPPPWGWTSITP